MNLGVETSGTSIGSTLVTSGRNNPINNHINSNTPNPRAKVSKQQLQLVHNWQCEEYDSRRIAIRRFHELKAR